MIDIVLGEVVSFKFTTVQTTGAPFALASGVISAYPDYPVSATQITSGVVLTADYDGVTGLNQVVVTATEANGFLPGSKYTLVITTGTVNSVSVVGYIVGEFTIQNVIAGVVDGVCAAGGSQTSIITSACVPNAGATDCFKGRIVIFDRNTTTAGLRGQATDCTANSSGATPTLTVTAMTTAPAAGDRFRIY